MAATRECAKILFEAPLPGKVTLRQDGKFLFGTVTIGYAGAASPDWQAALTSDLLTEIQFRERVESVLSKLGLPYCIFEGTEISPDSQLGEMAQALGAELLFQSIWQTEQIDNAILEACRTKRRNLFRTGPVAARIGQQFAIRRLTDWERSGPYIAEGYVGERIEQLIADGRLITAQTRYGQGLRTATEAELEMAENADPMQMHF